VKYDESIRHYEEGERSCPICKEPLPAHDTWPGFRYRYCGTAECAQKITRFRHIEANQYKCDAPNCENFVPEGFYNKQSGFYTCSPECWKHRVILGYRVLTCGCCGQEFIGRGNRKGVEGKYFLSQQHYGNYLHARYVNETSGIFRDLVNEYLDGFATLHYAKTQSVRTALGPFFLFLNERGIQSLDEVGPKTVTDYLTWTIKTGRRDARSKISYVSTFFRWAIAEGKCKVSNPVVPLIHRPKVPKRLPRPLSDDELDFEWQLLKERGTPQLRLAAAIAEEAGLRIGEICRLRLSDVDCKGHRLHVGLPNKTSVERWAFFSDKTEQYLKEWLAERNPDCGHDLLLYNVKGQAFKTPSLGNAFKRVLCKTYKGKKVNDTGFDQWSTHRLRHTMATNLCRGGADASTVMASGGWKTCTAMLNYVRIDEEQARHGYAEAMKIAYERKMAEPRIRTLSLQELLDHFKNAA
jgi:integrase/recombinase XerC